MNWRKAARTGAIGVSLAATAWGLAGAGNVKRETIERYYDSDPAIAEALEAVLTAQEKLSQTSPIYDETDFKEREQYQKTLNELMAVPDVRDPYNLMKQEESNHILASGAGLLGLTIGLLSLNIPASRRG